MILGSAKRRKAMLLDKLTFRNISGILNKLCSFHEPAIRAYSNLLHKNIFIARVANFILNGVYYSYKRVKNSNRIIQNFDYEGYASQYKNAPPRFGRKACLIAELSIQQCTHYRVEHRARQLEKFGFVTSIVPWPDFEAARDQLQDSAVVIFYRVPFFDSTKLLYKEAKRLGLKIFFEVDDLIFDEGKYLLNANVLALGEAQREELLNGVRLYRQALLAADCAIVSTQALADSLTEVSKPVFVVHNAIAPESFSTCPLDRSYSLDKIKIFYGSGSSTHDEDFLVASEALLQVLQDNPDVEFYVHGNLNLPARFDEVRSQVFKIGKISIHDYYRAIAEYDISICPLTEGIFNDAKSNIKYLEASILSIPSVCSPAAEFRAAIEHGVTGFLARSSEEWRECLQRLIDDPALRSEMATNARQKVLADYSLKGVAQAEVAPIVAGLPQPASRPHIMLVNILFGLNSLGGATTVVESLSQELIKQGYEISLFTTIQDTSLPENSLVRYSLNGIMVYAIVTHGIYSEQDYSESIKKRFEQLLEAFHVDLVHIHCIQHLGTGICEACNNAHIPYIITVHDAWWVCPRQFMIDVDGIYCDQKVVNLAVCSERCHFSAATLYARKFRMLEALQSAKRVLTPSHYFSHFMSRNSRLDTAIETNTNGISLPQQKSLKSTPKDEIVFGYVGGRAIHKGYFFLKDAFSSLRDAKYRLVLTDIHMNLGRPEIHDKEWGDRNFVEIIPPFKQTEIDAFFSKIDVLIFPSLWNESFGLTVREAIARNVFVIVSDCGGPSECVTHGDNGLIFPKGDLEAFRECLNFVFSNMDFIKGYETQSYGDIRSYSEQAKELAMVYDTATPWPRFLPD